MSLVSKKWWAEARKRFRAKSHPWFKKMKPALISIILIGAAGAAEVRQLKSEGEDIPNLIFYFCITMSAIATGMGIAAKMTVHDDHKDDVTPEQ